MNRRAEVENLAATERLIAEVAAGLGPGSIVALIGPLGAGKTAVVKAVVHALGLTDEVTSPTFVRLNVYGTSPTVYHLDLYRVANEAAFVALGLDEWLDTDGIALVEWADRAAGQFPAHTITVRLDFGEGPDARIITISEGPPPRPKAEREKR